MAKAKPGIHNVRDAYLKQGISFDDVEAALTKMFSAKEAKLAMANIPANEEVPPVSIPEVAKTSINVNTVGNSLASTVSKLSESNEIARVQTKEQPSNKVAAIDKPAPKIAKNPKPSHNKVSGVSKADKGTDTRVVNKLDEIKSGSIKDSDAILKQLKEIASLLKGMLKSSKDKLTGIPPTDDAKSKIGSVENALELNPKKRTLKDEFGGGSLRGFMSATGLSHEGGMIDSVLGRREHKQNKLADWDKLQTTPGESKSDVKTRKVENAVKYDKLQEHAAELDTHSKTLKGYQDRGWNDEQINKTSVHADIKTAHDKMSAIDPLITKLVEPKSQLEIKKQQSLVTPDPKTNAEAVVKAEHKVKEEPKSQLTLQQNRESITPVNAAAKEEEASDAKQVQDAQFAVLEEIRDNLAKGNGGKALDGKKPSTDVSNPLDKILDSMFSGIMGAVKSMFNPRLLMKVIGKVFVPAIIIGSLFSGITDGWEEWKKTGSITSALVAGVGGILDFLTFGLIDKDTLKDVSKFIEEPLSKFTESIADIFKGIGEFFTSAKDSVLNVLSGIGIPAITIPLSSMTSGLFDDKVIGPFYPFKTSAKTPDVKPSDSGPPKLPDADKVDSRAAASKGERDYAELIAKGDTAGAAITADTLGYTPKLKAIVPNSYESVATKSEANAEARDAKSNTSSGTTVVSAPTTNTNMNNTTVQSKGPVRSAEPSSNRLLSNIF